MSAPKRVVDVIDAVGPSRPLCASPRGGDGPREIGLTSVTGPARSAEKVDGLSRSSKARQRDRDDFDEMFRALLPRAKRVAYRILGDVTDAEDAAVEALARTSVRWRQLSALPSAQRHAWVLRVTANVAYDELRRRMLRRRPLPMESARDPRLGETTIDIRDWVVNALASLPRRQQQVLALRYIAALSEAEIATALGVRAGTVKSCASRGLATLRQRQFQRGKSSVAD